MLRNYLLVALRGLRLNRSASFINIAGLSIGMASFILILIYVYNESSYDKFHAKSDRLFRFTTIDQALGVSSNNVAITNPRMPAAAREEISDVVNATRVNQQGRLRIEKEDEVFYSEEAKYVEKNFFELFDYQLTPVDAVGAFNKPHKVILTEKMAHAIFGQQDALNKLLTINGDDWEVVGIMDDVKENSHLSFDVLLSIYPTEADSSFAQYLDNWGGLGMIGYAELESRERETSVEKQLQEMSWENDVPEFWVAQLQPLTEIHLNSTDILFDNYHINKGDRVYVYSLTAVALFILLIAAFNFMNLATAKSSTRAKEVGIRKVMGGSRGNLIGQHLGESVVLVLISTLIAMVLVAIVSPLVNLGLPVSLLSYLSTHPALLGYILLSTLIIGLLAGIYPAFVLSGFNTAVILRGKFTSSNQGIGLRKALVVLQFTASIVLIIGTVFVFRQISYIKKKDLGFKKDQVVTFQMNDPGMGDQMIVFRDRLQDYEDIEYASISNNMPGNTFGRTGLTPEGAVNESEDENGTWIVSVMSFDHHYLDMMQMGLSDGRNFHKDSESDQNNTVLVNEAFVSEVGWDDPVGKTVELGNDQIRTVIGVVRDFHFADMKHRIEPLIMFYNPGPSGNLSFRIKGENVRSVMQTAEELWGQFYTDYPFEYQFFDEEFDQLYRGDVQFSRLVISFTWLAIFIACLGLFGLSAYLAEQRRKEVGVRKVLGSSVTQVVILLSKEFMILIFIAMIIAWPIAYYSISGWLKEFQYRIDLLSPANILVFFVAGILALVIGLLTVGYQSRAAALVNPVNVLKEE